MRILVTGTAGFIGAAVAQRLLARGDEVWGIDNHNDYYDPGLKEARLARFGEHPRYTHQRADLADGDAINHAFGQFQPQRVVNLAAQAGVRYSLENPHAYCRATWSASSTSWRPAATTPSSTWYTPRPARSMAPTARCRSRSRTLSTTRSACMRPRKKANELMAHTYSHLYRLPTTGLRFFTVYGPWGRPDMSPMLFADRIMPRRTDRRVQPRPPQPRLHLHRRHRRGRGPHAWTTPPNPTPPTIRCAPDPGTVRWARIGSTTSATTSRWS